MTRRNMRVATATPRDHDTVSSLMVPALAGTNASRHLETVEAPNPIGWYRTMTPKFATTHFGFPKVAGWFDRTHTAPDGGKWELDGGEWELREAPAKAPPCAICNVNESNHSMIDYQHPFTAELCPFDDEGTDRRDPASASEETNSELWIVRTVEERQALPRGAVIRSLNTGLVEERWGDGSWRVSGHNAVLDGLHESAFPCEVLYPHTGNASPAVLADEDGSA